MISPVAENLRMASPRMNISGSYSATSTTSPSPRVSRRNSAMAVPNAAEIPAMESAEPKGGDVGGVSGQPLRKA